jgi:hypothetical protein
VLQDAVEPKLALEARRLEELRAGASTDGAARARKQMAAQEAFVDELRAFRDEIARIAPLWNPNLEDGVIINFSPLWRLVSHPKSWQKELKAVWDDLRSGELDWTHLALHLWPERVIPKCTTDRSLAIAHQLDATLWCQDDSGKWAAKTDAANIAREQIRTQTSSAVESALRELLDAPTTPGNRNRRRSAGAATEEGTG